MTKPRVIAIEEHYLDADVRAQFLGNDAGPSAPPAIAQRLSDLGELRIREMDEAGIDVQVLSLGAPATQKMDAERGLRIARLANDNLHRTIQNHPTRFAGFAALPTADPLGSAAELERTVTKFGFKGAMVHGLTNGAFLDEKRFWPIFERAQALDVPIYLHPSVPDDMVIDRYYKDYVKDHPAILTAGWGFTVEAATQAIRMVLSGVFDAYPNLKIILGHLGEGIPFSMWRIDHHFGRSGKNVNFRDIFTSHFWVTTSGNFSDPALLCTAQELGVDRIIFSVDYPFADNKAGMKWIDGVSLCAEDRAKILHGNAEKLLRM